MLPVVLFCCLAPAQPAEPRGFDLRPLPFVRTGPPANRPAGEVAFSADGRLLAAADGDIVRVWTVADGREKTRIHLPHATSHTHLAFLPDGNTLLAVGSTDTAVRWFDLATGKQTRERPQPPPQTKNGTFYPTVVRLSPTGDWHLGYGVEEKEIRAMVWDTATGDRRAVLQNHPIFILQRVLPLGDRRQFVDVTYTADAPVRVWDLATGRPVRGLGRRSVQFGSSWPDLKAASSDGRLVAANLSDSGSGGRTRTEIWRTDDGRLVTALPEEATSVAFAADGRTLVFAGNSGVRVYDLARDAFDPEYVLPTPARCSVASRDGKTLAVLVLPRDQQPGELLVGPFPTLPEPLPAAGDLAGDRLTEALAMLASANEVRGRYAVRAFAARPDQAVAELGAKLTPDTGRRRATVADLIKTLDDDSPDTRDKALAELLPLAHRFEPVLTAAHATAPPGEVRNRLATALGTARDASPPADLLTDLRTVEVLEQVATAAAKELLTKLAGGAAGSRLTADAAAARDRLAGTGTPVPDVKK